MSRNSHRGKVVQSWDPERYARNARFVADLGMPVVELLAPRPGERILDLGCGDGVLTKKLADAGCQVVGIDFSAAQVAAARRRGVDAFVGDGQSLEFFEEFDAVFSNAALHWMKQADRVIEGVWNALKPGGRFVAECGGAGNVERIESALCTALRQQGIDPRAVHPWYFPSPRPYREKLEACGFVVLSMELIPRPTILPGDLSEWLETFAESFVQALPPEERAALIDEVRAALRDELCDREGRWTADYVRLRFSARKPESA